MMMVVTVMAVALHLIKTIRQKGALCQLTDLQDRGIWRQSFLPEQMGHKATGVVRHQSFGFADAHACRFAIDEP